jgi:phosphoserine phosphatase RsbX
VRLAFAQRSRPRLGETHSGDVALVREEGPLTLFAVVDALGHGTLAAATAAAAVRCLQVTALAGGVAPVLEALHAALLKERGAVALVGLFDGQKLSCAGVGNVELRTQGTRIAVALSPGILGQRYRRLTVSESTLRPGDRFAVFTDGLSLRTDLEEGRGRTPAEACALLFERFAKPQDDATLLIADVEHDS